MSQRTLGDQKAQSRIDEIEGARDEDWSEPMVTTSSADIEIGERLRKMDERAPIDLRSLCDRLDDVFDEDGDTSDELSQLAMKAIESLWAERDARQLALQGLQEENARLQKLVDEWVPTKEHPLHILPSFSKMMEDRQTALQGLADALRMFTACMECFGNWDDGCFYYHGQSMSELQEPIEQARTAREAAKPFLREK